MVATQLLSHSAELIAIWFHHLFSQMGRNSALLSLKIYYGYFLTYLYLLSWEVTEQNMLLNATLDLGRKIVVILHGKWEAPLSLGGGAPGRGCDNSWPCSAIWLNVYYLEKSWISIKNQHMKLPTMKLSLEGSRRSSLVSEDGPVYTPTALQAGNRRTFPFIHLNKDCTIL